MKALSNNKCRIAISVIVLILNTLVPVSAQEFYDTVEIELDAQFGNIDESDGTFYQEFRISPDNSYIAVRKGEQIEVWEIASQSLLSTIDDSLGVFAWNPASTQIATMTFETELFIWDVFTGDLLQTIDGIEIQSNGVRSLQWYQEDFITSSSLKYVKWDLTSSDMPQIVDCHPYGTRHWWSPNNDYFATLGFSTLVWICNQDFKQVISFEGYQTIAWNPDSTEVATVGIFNTLRVWDITSGEVVITVDGGENNILDIAWHSEGIRLATGHLNGELRIWDRLTPDAFWVVGKSNIAELNQVEWLGDQLITTSRSQGIQIWNIR